MYLPEEGTKLPMSKEVVDRPEDDDDSTQFLNRDSQSRMQNFDDDNATSSVDAALLVLNGYYQIPVTFFAPLTMIPLLSVECALLLAAATRLSTS